jgi:TonB family protein
VNTNLKDELDLIDNKKSSKSSIKKILLAGILLAILYLIFSSILSSKADKDLLVWENLIDQLNSTINQNEKENFILIDSLAVYKEKNRSYELDVIGLNKEMKILTSKLKERDNLVIKLNADIVGIEMKLIESKDDDYSNNLTIEETDLDNLDAWDAPPTSSSPQVKFIPYDKAPVPLTPIRPVYPDIAQEAGIEGKVIVQCFIDKQGKVKETIILEGVPKTGLNESAITALRKTRFRPAEQRQKKVGVWITIPINFTLQN